MNDKNPDDLISGTKIKFDYDNVVKQCFKEAIKTGDIKKICRELKDADLSDFEYIEQRLNYPQKLEIDLGIKTKSGIIHFEFQASNDANMPYRMLLYFIVLTNIYQLPVKQIVIYIGKDKMNMPDSYTRDNIHFKFSLIDFSSLNIETFAEVSNLKVKILQILTKQGLTENSIGSLIKQLEQINSKAKQKKIVEFMATLANLRNNGIILIKRFFEVFMSKTIVHLEDLDSFNRGQAKGEAMGLAKGEAMGLARGLINLIEAKFGKQDKLVIQKINQANSSDLNRWLVNVLNAKSIDDVMD